MEFYEFRGFGVFGENAGSFQAQPAAPTRKNVGSLNLSKEQGARSKAGSELHGLIIMDSIEFL